MPINYLNDLTGLPGAKKKPVPNPYAPSGAETTRDAQGGYSTPSTLPGYAPTTALPGWQPDYAALINNDPNFKQLQTDLTAQSFADQGSRNAAINRALVNFGSVPDISRASQALGFDVGQVVDPTTGETAANNPYSTTANLTDAHKQAVSQLRHALAARGALQSGEFGYQLGQENKNYGQANYDSSQKLLDYIAGAQQAYAEAEKQRQGQVAAGRTQAAQFQSSLPQNQPQGASTATLDQGASQQWGFAVYKGQDGKLYKQDGTPVTGNPTPPAVDQTQQTGIDPSASGGLNIGALLAPGVYSGHRLDPRYNQ